MTATIASEALAAILARAAASPGAEVCGLLLGRGDAVAAALPCGNVAADPARAFEIDPAQLLAAHRAARGDGPAIVGCYHSHPSGIARPSPRDAAAAAPDGWLWIIVADGGATAWRAVAQGAREGRFDPVALRVVPAPVT